MKDTIFCAAGRVAFFPRRLREFCLRSASEGPNVGFGVLKLIWAARSEWRLPAPFDQSISFKLTKRQKRGPRRDPDSFADQARDYTARVFMPVARSAPRASAPAPDPFYSVF